MWVAVILDEVKVTFSAIPAYGHLLPMVPLAAAAAAAGHDVTFAAGDTFAGRLPVRVVAGVPSGLTLHDAEEQAKAEITDRTDPFAFPTAMFGIVMPRHIVPRLHELWAREGAPDLVVHEGSNVGAAIAAREVGVPSVSFHIAMGPPAFFLSVLSRVTDVEPGPTLDPRPAIWVADDEPPFDRVPIRSVAWSNATEPVPEWISAAPGPKAYVTLGTVAFGAVEVMRRSVVEAAERCERVLVAAGPDGDPTALGELPDRVRVERFVDQAAVLDQVDLAIHHGGTGTVLGCLAAGVPQVVTPQGADQFINAARISELGLGVAVGNDAPDRSVVAAVDRVLTDELLRSRVVQARDEIAAMPSPESVVRLLEQLADRGRS